MSDFTFTNVEVNTSEGIQNYGTILAGQETVYKRFDRAYRQAQIELFIENEKYTFIPVTYTYMEAFSKMKVFQRIGEKVSAES